MAQRVQIVLIDDIDGGEATETVSFALDGVSYEIDLSDQNAAKLRDSVASWVASARRVSGRSRRSGSGRSGSSQQDPSAIRVWAKANGQQVSDRGRIPAHVIEAYNAAR